MSQRELQIETQVSSLRGVNERMEAVLLETDLVSSSRNIYFGLDGVASRIEGKKLSGVLNDAILNLHQFGEKVLVQTLATLQVLTVEELITGEFLYPPADFAAPTYGSIVYTTLQVLIPTLPEHADQLDVYWSTDDVSFALLQSDVTPSSTLGVSSLTSNTTYYFKFRAFGPGGITDSPSSSATTLDYVFLVSDQDEEDQIVSDTDSSSKLYTD